MNDPIANWGSIETPYNQEAEEATLGATIINGADYFRVAAFLKPDGARIIRWRLHDPRHLQEPA